VNRGVALKVVLAAGVAVLALGATSRVAPAQESKSRAAAPSKCVTQGTTQRRGRMIFPELRKLRVRVWSGSLRWSTVAPTRPKDPTSPDDPAYKWPSLIARELASARANGIEPVINVSGFPAWSNGGRDWSWAPTNPQDYANFMAAAVAKYPQVRRWIIVSEPSSSYNFQPQGGKGRTAPRLYARMLDAAYVAMHRARKNVVVIGGGVHPYGLNDTHTTAPDTFIANMVLPNGRRPRLDLFAINPYTERPLNLKLGKQALRVDFDDLDWLKKRLDQLWPRRHLKIFVDEFGWNTEHEALGWLYFVSRKQQAANLGRAYALAAKIGRIDTMCWYLLDDQPAQRTACNG
jgi:hypothetical protein